MADRKKHVFDDDIVALVDDEVAKGADRIKLVALRVVAGSEGPQNVFDPDIDGAESSVDSTGDGPVDTTFNAINALFPHEAALQLYQVRVTEGTDAQAEVSVRLEESGKTVTGQLPMPILWLPRRGLM